MRVLVIYCHPRPESLCAAALERVVGGLGRAGHDVEVRDLYAMGFSPTLTLRESARGPASDRSDVLSELGALEAADGLVFVYPTWWGGQPAMLKGWLDRVLESGGAYQRTPGRGDRATSLKRIRSLVVVTTHGSSKWVNTLQGEPGKRVLLRGLRPLLARRARCRWVAAYGIDRSSDADRSRFLDRVEASMARL